MQDGTINNALLALRKQMIREGQDGLTHVEALLTARGVYMPAVLPAKRPDVARRGQMRRQVLEAVRGGATLRQVAAHVASLRPELSERQAYIRSGQCLARLKAGGRVKREGRVWLAP